MKKLRYGRIACIVAIFCVASAVALPAQTLTTILSFNGNAGIQPESLIQGDDGNLFGAMQNGGAYSWGTIYEMTTSGTQTTLYSFCREANCPDGGFPISIMQGSDGSFYDPSISEPTASFWDSAQQMKHAIRFKRPGSKFRRWRP